MEFKSNIGNAINQRLRENDSLSWIENFGLHLINDKRDRRLIFGDQDHILVLHIQNKEKKDTINAYYSYFIRTSSKGTPRFCINAPFNGVKLTTNKLWDLMVEMADWNSNETRKWWECVFPKGQSVDDTILQRVVVSDKKESSDMKMSEFVSSISAEFEKVIAELGVGKDKFTKVCIVGHYAKALPVLYALRKMFKNKYVAPFVFTKKDPMVDFPWQQNSHNFFTPKKLLDYTIKSTPQMTIGDVLSLREKGVTFTLPLSKGENGEYCLPTTSVIDNSELKWNDLIKGDIEPDYMVGDLAFKRVHLSVFADGFQNVYLNTHDNIVSAGISTNGKSIYINKSEAGQSPDNSVHTVPHKNNPMSNTDKETENGELIKNANLNAEIQRALTLTLGLLRQEAYFFIRKRYPNKTVGILFDEWIKNKRKNGGKYSQQLIENWEHYKRNHVDWEIFDNQTISDLNTGMLDYGNYYVFVEQNWDKLAEEWNRNNKFIIDQIREIRNMLRSDSSHQIVHNFEKETVMDLFTNMRNIAKIFDKKEVMDEIAKVRSRVYEMM